MWNKCGDLIPVVFLSSFTVPLQYVKSQVTSVYCTCRSELDHVCSPDMSSEEFSVTLDVIVPQKERPPAAATSCPWQGYSRKGVSPKLLFKTKEELLAVTAEFGKC